ncbi:AAA family ATPase [Floridanema evergladense]|uniref:AAA family ATPase n=1 Tax=Floridaenema evergladense BLCC-F167 TaxID=3153639 RepID=A0ABV4WN80_9CYAN
MKPIVVGFAGSIASGKSTLSIEVASSLEWQRVSFGDYVRTVAQSQGLGDSREALQAVGASLINQGMEQFCKAVLAQVNWQPGQPLVVDGIRHAEIIPVLRQIVTPLDFRLVFVGVNESIREARLVERGLSDRQQWQLLEAHSTEAQVQTALPAMADLTVDGTRKIEDLVLEIVGWIKQ